MMCLSYDAGAVRWNSTSGKSKVKGKDQSQMSSGAPTG